MAEIKVKKELTAEISALRSTGNAINSEYAAIQSDDVQTLKTSMAIISQHNTIKELMELYKELVLRDAKDMDSFVAEMEKADQASASAKLS